MILVAADAKHPVSVDVDENAADRGADAAEAADRLHSASRSELADRLFLSWHAESPDTAVQSPWRAIRCPHE